MSSDRKLDNSVKLLADTSQKLGWVRGAAACAQIALAAGNTHLAKVMTALMQEDDLCQLSEADRTDTPNFQRLLRLASR